IAVCAVMLVLYRTRIIKVTERFRRIVVAATIGVMLFYGVTLLIRLFAGADAVSFLASPSLLGIGFSIFVAGLAAFNLALDFDFIERGAEQRLDKNFEWFAAFGLLVTIIWLYLELLRLLAKLRER
ncbi:MAG: Bax inhibitor-1/YccA family membrane protein, partial [Ilumatobacteraceae bacterium]